MKKYIPVNKKSKYSELRHKLFNEIESKENHYNHHIPPKAIVRTLEKHDLHAKYEYTINVSQHRYKDFKDYGKKHLFSIRDKKGINHGEIGYNLRTQKVDFWGVS
jgi:hypothetical protein